MSTTNWFQDALSRVGQAVGAPVIFDWDTPAAQEDAASGAKDSSGNTKRSAGSAAFDAVNKDKQTYSFGGNIYNYAGDVIGKYDQGNDSSASSSSSSGGSGDTSAAEKAQTIGLIDEQIAAIDKALGNLGGVRTAGLTQLDDQFNKGLTRLNQQHSDNTKGFDTKESDTKRDFSRSTEDIDINSGNKYRALMNLLGRVGAGRSSASQNVVPYAVSQDASKSRGDVADIFSTNMRDLRDARDDEKTSYDNGVNDLGDTRRTSQGSLENDIKTKESAYHDTRASLLAKKVAAQGGGWDQAKSAMASDIAARDEIDKAVANLLSDSKYRNPYTVQDISVDSPTLDNYSSDLGGVSVSDPNGTGYSTDTSAEYLARIKDEEKRKQAASGSVA